MHTKRIVAGLVTLAMLLSGCGGSTEATPTPQVTMAPPPMPQVSVKGEVVPAVWATLSAQTGGTVLEVLVEPGDELAAGDLLIRFDPTNVQLAVQRAEVALESAQAQLAHLKAGPRPEQVAAAEAHIEAARAALSQAAAQRDQLKSGTTDAEIAAAQADVAAAQAEQLVARDAHDQTMKCYDIPGSDDKACPLLGPLEEQARFRLHAADEALAAAQARLDALVAGADDQIRAADAAVWATDARLEVAQAELALLQAGATVEEIAIAQVAVEEAEVALAEARVALEHCEIRAPIAGTAGAVRVRMGESVVPGQPLITLGDLTTLRIETTDLDDVDVAQVRLNQPAAVTFDALPGRVFTGRVARISPMAEPDLAGGDNYTVIVALDELAPEIRWGMDAFVTLEVE